MRRGARTRVAVGIAATLALVLGQAAAGGRAWPATARASSSTPCAAVTAWPLTGCAREAAGKQPSVAVPQVNAAGGNLKISVAGSQETAQGSALTSPLSGGDYVRVHGLGTVARVTSGGRTVWQRGSASLYSDWKLKWQQDGSVPTPQMVSGIDPVDPFQISGVGNEVVHDTKPYAVGDLNGDGVPDVAVADVVGVNLGLANCFRCAWPFTVPGSSLQLGTFVTVLDGRNGHTLYSELDPGYVTHLVAVGRTLVIGDVTGPPQSRNGIGQWGSATTVRGLTLRSDGGRLRKAHSWTFATHAQWGQLFGVEPAGGGRIAVAWSDTPLGLGVTGPPDGHVVLLDGNGRTRWDVRTAGYPTLMKYDPTRGLLAVVEQADTTRAIGYTLAGLSVSNGRPTTQTRSRDELPTTLTVGVLAGSRQTCWLVGGVATTPDQVQPPNYSYTAGLVTAVDPGRARVRWSTTLTDRTATPPEPGSVLISRSSAVVVGSWTGPVAATPGQPIDKVTDLQMLAASNGAVRWQRSGDVADPLSLSGTGSGAVLGVTEAQDAVSFDVRTGAASSTPILSDLYAAVVSHAATDGVNALVAGGQSGGLYAFNPRHLGQIRWQAKLSGPIHQILLTRLGNGGPTRLVVAAGTSVAVVDLASGRVLTTIPLSGQYVWNVAVGNLGPRTGTGIVVATDRLSAFTGDGRRLWTYRPAAASFSNAAVLQGTVVAEYQVTSAGKTKAMAAVGVDGATGKTAWSAAQDPATTVRAELYNGVVASASIPGAGGDGAAFAWETKDYAGRVDVRDARTGVLRYSNTDPALDLHRTFVVDPRAGLVALGQQGTVTVKPGGPVVQSDLGAADAAITTSGGAMVYLTADTLVSAYPGSVLNGGTSPDPLAADQTFLPGRIIAAGAGQIISLPVDWPAWQIVNDEAGVSIGPYSATVQRGLVELSITGTPPATAAHRATAAPHAVTPSATAPAGVPVGIGVAVAKPQFVVANRVRDQAGRPLRAGTAPAGYSPAAVSAYLGLHGDGSGQTVAVVDAYTDAAIAADVDHFSAQFSLPKTCGTSKAAGCFKLTTTQPGGSGGGDPDWALETSLDVEWIHSVAPKAAVRLYEAHDGSFASLFHAVDAAAAGHPDAISLSWGVQGEFTDETYYDSHCKLAKSLCVFSSGDDGHPGSAPAYSPYALSVGGTTLNLGAAGKVLGETSWNGSGGGRSFVRPRPAYQRGAVTGGYRGMPDVSFDADPQTGVAVYDSTPYSGQSGWFQVGGTSLGAPVWSAIMSAADQLRGKAGKPPLTGSGAAAYGLHGALGDIVTGPVNGYCPIECQAAPGYDFVTGLGSPRSGIDTALAK